MALADDLKEAVTILRSSGVPSPEADAVLLAAHLLGVNPGEARAAAIRGVDTPEGFRDLVKVRAERVPVQHITGATSFAGVELAVGAGVFIPRPETESMVQRVDTWIRTKKLRDVTIVDLCTGSAAIACALKMRYPLARVVAVERERAAFAWAERNTAETGIELVCDDALTTTCVPDASVDVVVANPPYIPAQMVPVDPEVSEYDPPEALYGGEDDGLMIPRGVLRTASRLLRPGGLAAMEHADTQQHQLIAYAAHLPLAHVRGHQDAAGKPRFITAIAQEPEAAPGAATPR